MGYAKRTSFSYHHRHHHHPRHSIIIRKRYVRFGTHTLTRPLFRMGSPISLLLLLLLLCSTARQLDLSRRKRILYNVPTALHTRIHAPNKWNIKHMWTLSYREQRSNAPQKPWVYFFIISLIIAIWINPWMRACDVYHAKQFNQQPVLIFNPATKFNIHTQCCIVCKWFPKFDKQICW